MTIDNYPHAVYYGNITTIQEQPIAKFSTYPTVRDHYLTMSIVLIILSTLFGIHSLICSFPALIFSIKVHCFILNDISCACTCFNLIEFFFF